MKNIMTKEEIKEIEKSIINLTNDFCNQKLDEELRQLCENLVLKLGRKREVPFIRGRIEIWAAAVVHLIASLNFLFDKSTENFTSIADICEFFNVKSSSFTNKSREIRESLRMGIFCPEFSTRKINETNPMNDLVMVNGFIVPRKFLK